MNRSLADPDTTFDELVVSDPAMRRYVLAFAQRVSELRGFALGLYAEALVADVLDASLSAGGTDTVDIRWEQASLSEPLTIQVRSCRPQNGQRRLRGSLSISPPRHRQTKAVLPRRTLGSVWVFAIHTGDDHRSGWRFHARAADRLDAAFELRSSVSIERLAPFSEWIGTVDLRGAVLLAGSETPL